MDKERIAYLLDRYLNKAYTESERQEFISLLRSDETANFLEQLNESYTGVPETGIEMDEETSEVIRFALMTAIRSDNTGLKKGIRRRLFIRYAAAAAIVGLIFGTYYILSPTKGDHSQQSQITNDIPPGGNKAMLILANGQKIILGSAGNGQLALQGNTKITKTDSGRLAYHADKSSNTVEPVLFNTLSTPRGGQYQLQLPDGTNVWLNSASSITYPTAFIGKERQVTITGEAYFEVTKDKIKPFHVRVRDMDVKVLGTHFNINAYDDETAIKTTLLEGSVKLARGKEQGITLVPGQQGQYTLHQLTVINNPDIDQVMAWKNGLFNFNKADLQTVMRQLGRWYDVEIIYEKGVPEMRFGGEIGRNLTLSDALDALKRTDVHFRIDGKTIIVMP